MGLCDTASEVRGRRDGVALSLGQYVRRRNGVPMGASGSFRGMMVRAFGAASFAGFWRYWNPIFGYYLGRYIYTPASRVVPRPLALVVTFLACGAIHDAVTVLARGTTRFLFTWWFLFFALGVVLGEAAGLNLARRPFAVRAGVHLAYLCACLGLAMGAQRLVAA